MILFGGRFFADASLAAFARANHWTANGPHLYSITNHEATVKSRNIEEKLDFERGLNCER